MREKNVIILCGIICTTLIICGILFWPTLYRYDKVKVGESTLPVRINRLTGYTETFFGKQWIGERIIKMITQEEKNNIEVEGFFDDRMPKELTNPQEKWIPLVTNYKGTIYNGTEWNINKICLSIGGKDKAGKIHWQKLYEVSVYIPPLSRGHCLIELMDNPHIIDNPLSPDVKVEKAFGYKGE